MRAPVALALLALAVGATPGCAQPTPPAGAAATPPTPASLQQALREGRVPKDALVVHAPDGRPAYLLSAPCCDQFNPLYDADGRYICAPSGGFTGRGDGHCPDWVWEALKQPKAPPPPGPAPSSAATR